MPNKECTDTDKITSSESDLFAQCLVFLWDLITDTNTILINYLTGFLRFLYVYTSIGY